MSPTIPIGYALANLPRYTSYPTAPHFAPLEEATYRAWLGGIGPEDRLSLYVHIPFCQSLCWYCGCHTAITRSAPRIARYAAALEREAALLAEALPAAHGGMSDLHLGGGTPNAIGAAAIGRLLTSLRRLFRVRPGAELAAECDPRTLDEASVAALAEGGLTRASLGVQDINEGVQRRIGRLQETAVVAAAVRRLRAAGVLRVNLDVMYGLPGQSEAHVAATARFAADLGADRVAVFGYAHVPWMKPHQNAIRTEDLPGALERLRQAERAETVLREAGYQAIGFDHFAWPEDPMAIAARDGTLRRNFQGYTTDGATALLGLGASAIGALDTPRLAAYAQNAPDERGYVAAVEAGALPVRRGRPLSTDDRIRRHAIERVMCDFALDLGALPPTLVAGALPALRQLEADGILALEPDMLWVTEAGRRHVRHVAASFDAYLGAGKARHSAAV